MTTLDGYPHLEGISEIRQLHEDRHKDKRTLIERYINEQHPEARRSSSDVIQTPCVKDDVIDVFTNLELENSDVKEEHKNKDI